MLTVELCTAEREGHVVVALRGELDAVDLGALVIIDGHDLGAVLRAREPARRHDGPLADVAACGRVRR